MNTTAHLAAAVVTGILAAALTGCGTNSEVEPQAPSPEVLGPEMYEESGFGPRRDIYGESGFGPRRDIYGESGFGPRR